jgi:crotonobetainyl-CoA:carnitine CoA-transferase CaiB-like acyl-CoA transferase
MKSLPMREDLTHLVCDVLDASPESITAAGHGSLPSAYRVTDLAVASVAGAAAALRDLIGDTEESAAIAVDRDLASHWFALSIRPDGWQLPPIWDAVAGDYPTADGWIRLHTNAPHHRAAALGVLDAPEDRAAVGAAVSRWAAADLEQAIVEAGGAAAAMRTSEEWAAHPQGIAVAGEPLIDVGFTGPAPSLDLPGVAEGRPLAGIRVLDLTRVLAGPVATRLLAGWGAQVLRIDPPTWDEPGVIPEVLLGKRTARLDLHEDGDRERFVRLLAEADVFVHGYRSDALTRLGFDEDALAAINPGLVDVSLDAYGWTGPWATRRGFDSLVQMSTGIAAEGMRSYSRDRPTPLPVQALDHATGYLLAAAALRGLKERRTSQRASRSRLSLARTAKLLTDAGAGDPDAPAVTNDPPVGDAIENTAWGPARRLVVPVIVTGAALRWELPARALGSDAPVW